MFSLSCSDYNLASGEKHWQFSLPRDSIQKKQYFYQKRSVKFHVLLLYLHLRAKTSIVATLPSLDLYFHWTFCHTSSRTIISCPQAAFSRYSGPQHALVVLHVTLSTTGKEAKCQIRFLLDIQSPCFFAENGIVLNPDKFLWGKTQPKLCNHR